MKVRIYMAAGMLTAALSLTAQTRDGGISQKMLSIHDKYCIDIYQPEHEEVVVAILVALQHMIRDRENSSSASSSSSSN